MTVGIGGVSKEDALSSLGNMVVEVESISIAEYKERLAKAQDRMRVLGIEVLYLNAGTNLKYFTGLQWHPSERMVGAILPAEGELRYLCPTFEEATIRDYMVLEGSIHCWEEHESPYGLFADVLKSYCGQEPAKVAIDESCTFFVFDGIRQFLPSTEFVTSKEITAFCRMRKSQSELKLMQKAKDMTLAVHKATASILHEGICTTEVEAFINAAHKKVGASGSYFCIVLFGEASSYPHGVKDPQYLKEGDIVLIDTGCKVEGYISDITRTYVFGEANERQRFIWNLEKRAQAAAFNAAKIGATCESVDYAAREVLEAEGFGPDYKLPGLPHRTGHGIGVDIHEWPYLVRGDKSILQPGMCFSNEPMICLPGEFGMRHEDHFYMTESGPRWFTEPAHSIDDPFGIEKSETYLS